ncbi:MAG TPA: hypothetical protein VMH86_11015 [Rhizomicrobium sp.]|nr:hypothetical protein [Rhizomicrobium sp.]
MNSHAKFRPQAHAEVSRFGLLLSADAKLVEAAETLRRAGLVRNVGQLAALRASVAKELNGLQEDVYERITAD